MRSKRRASRAQRSKLPPPSTTTRPLPLPNLNGEFNMDRIVLESDDGVEDPTRDFIMDWLEGETCIVCDKGGQVLVCCETGCPIALHEKCMNNQPKFDSMGKFYCPYCWYKQKVKRTKELRKMAMLAKKALSNFIDLKMVGGGIKEKQEEDGRVKGKEPNVYGDCENRLEDDDQVKDREDYGDDDKLRIGKEPNVYCDQRGIVDEHQTDPSSSVLRGDDNVHRGQEETTLGVESLRGSRSVEKLDEEDVSETHEYEVKKDGERIEAEPLNACRMEEEETEDGSHHVSTKGICDTVMVSEEKQEGTEEEEQKHSKVPETTMLSTGGNIAPEAPAEDVVESELSDSDSEALLVRQRRIKQRGKKKARIQNVDSPKKSPFQRKKARTRNVDSPKISPFQRKKARTQNVDSPKKSPSQRKKARCQIVDSPRKSASQPDATAEGNTRNQNMKVTTPKKSRQPQESGKRFTNVTIANEKRKRLHWTAEEEEMLKEGVHKFSTTVNKNLPWRKILEFGRHVFDVTRTPIDLKDKWRNIMAKEPSAMNRR